MGLLTGGGGPILGAIGGAIRPTPGLSMGESILHGFASGIPAWRLLGSLSHLFTGTLNQWGDPANNPFTRTAGNDIPTLPSTNVTPDPYDPTSQGQEQQPAPQQAGQATQAPIDMAGLYNSLRIPFAQTWQQINNPGSAIGPFGGGIQNPYNPNAALGAPYTVDTGIPHSAAAIMNWIKSRNIA